MTTSGRAFPQRLTKIDDLSRTDHYFLSEDDDCYFLGEYTARKGFSFSSTNDLILNFKKEVSRKERPEWAYKERAILQAATAFQAALEGTLGEWTFVPVPPSKFKGDPLYDDRLVRMLRAINSTPPLDVREIVVQRTSSEAAHDSADRPSPLELERGYDLDPAELARPIRPIAVVDDVLTTGAHFAAMKSILVKHCNATRVIGLFIARRVPETEDLPW